MKRSFVSFIFYLFLLQVIYVSLQRSYRQEAARIDYFNPKYLKDVTVLTARSNRQTPYLTNLTGTSLMSYGNNVTASIKLGSDVRFLFKLCDVLNITWASEFLKKYTDIPLKCPILAGTYNFINMELPPRNMPIMIQKGSYKFEGSLSITGSKEIVIAVSMMLHFEDRKTTRKGNKGFI